MYHLAFTYLFSIMISDFIEFSIFFNCIVFFVLNQLFLYSKKEAIANLQ